MTAYRRVEPLTDRFDLTVALPGSKSLTNRALVCAALADGTSTLTGALFADDTEAMIDSLQRLGAGVVIDRDARRIEVEGTNGLLAAGPIELDARLSGTTARFLLPVLAIGVGPLPARRSASVARPTDGGWIRDCCERSVSRVMADDDGHLPVTIRGGVSNVEARASPASASSQFLSGVLLAAPAWPGGRRVIVEGELVSRPYVDMTIAVMRAFGAEVDEESPTSGTCVPPATEEPSTRSSPMRRPPRTSSPPPPSPAAECGSRAWAPAACRATWRSSACSSAWAPRVTIDDDATTVEGTGALHGVEADLRDFSDTAQTLAVTGRLRRQPDPITGHRLHPRQGDRPHRRGGPGARPVGHPRRRGTRRPGGASGPAHAGRGRDLRRPPHGHELRPGRPGRARYRDRRSRLRGQDVPGLLRCSRDVARWTCRAAPRVRCR